MNAIASTSSHTMTTQHPHPRYSIFTHSVGYFTSDHSLLSKLDAVSAAGMHAVEIFTEDLWHFAQSAEFTTILATSSSGSGGGSSAPAELLTPPDSPLSKHAQLQNKLQQQQPQQKWYNSNGECTPEQAQREVAAAAYIRRYCAERRLEVSCLQPIRDVEGWLDADARACAMARVRSRFDVMRALDTHLLLICSSNIAAPQTTGDVDVLVADFHSISELASAYTAETGFEIRIGYEALSWGAHVDLWSQAWGVVERVDRANVGLILDAFNTLGREFADPCSATGIQQPLSSTLAALDASLARIATLPGDKIFLLQIGDAHRMPEPLQPSPREGEPRPREGEPRPREGEPRPSRMIWSRSSRLFPLEQERGGFMPVHDFVKAVVKTGYRGVWSIEVFNSSLEAPGVQVEREHAMRARVGLDRLVEVVFA